MEEREGKQATEAGRKLREYENEIESMRGRVEALGRTLDTITSKLEAERKSHEKALSDLTREQN